jgi:SAM-dependent methyltransferase
MDQVFQWVTSNLDIRDKLICDIGVGPGTSSFHLARLGAGEITSIEPGQGKGGRTDVFETLVSNIRKNGMEQVIRPMKMDFMQNGFADNSFDFVFAVNSLHHVVERSTDRSNFDGLTDRLTAALTEMVRITKPGGKIVLWDIAFDSIFRSVRIRYRQFDWYLHPTMRMWKESIRQTSCAFHVDYPYFFSIPLSRYFMRNYVALYLLNPTFKLTLEKH